MVRRPRVVPWDSQPQEAVNLGDDFGFNRGLIPGADFRDLASGQAYALAGGAVESVGPAGRVIAFPGAADNRLILGTGASTVSGTHVFEVNVSAYGANGGVLYSSSFNDATAGAFQLRVGTAGEMWFIRQNAALVAASAAGVIPLNRPCRIAASLTANGSGIHAAAIDGQVVIDASFSSTYTVGAAVIGDQGAVGANVPLNGQMSLWLYSPVAHPAAALRSISANPWQLFAPRRIYTPRATGIVIPTLQALPRIDAARRQDRYIWTP